MTCRVEYCGVFEMNLDNIDWENLGIREGEPGVDTPVEKVIDTVLDDRCVELKQFFKDAFDESPDYIVRVPGR